MRDHPREAVREHFVINGIDYLDVSPADETRLTVTFIHNLADAANHPLAGHVPAKADFVIQGGERIRPVLVKSATRQGDDRGGIVVDQVGDLSTYPPRLRALHPSPSPPPPEPPARAGDARGGLRPACFPGSFPSPMSNATRVPPAGGRSSAGWSRSRPRRSTISRRTIRVSSASCSTAWR